MSSRGWKVSNMLLGESRGQLLIVPERTKQLGQSGNYVQLWMCLVMKVKSDAGKNSLRTWNVKLMNQGKSDVVKQEMARVNVDILGISELKWTGVGEFNSDDHYIYFCGQESLRRNGVALIINKRVQWSTWVQYQKWQNDLCSFPRKTIHVNPSLCHNQ